MICYKLNKNPAANEERPRMCPLPAVSLTLTLKSLNLASSIDCDLPVDHIRAAKTLPIPLCDKGIKKR